MVNCVIYFSGIGIEQGSLSGHRTLIIFCKLIAHYICTSRIICHDYSVSMARENETLSLGKVREF